MNNNSPTPPESPDPFDAFLREADAHIPDNGFTTRVLRALPPRRRFDPVRLGLFAVAWLTGAVIVLLRAPTVAGPAAAFLEHFRHGELAPLLALAPVVFGIGCLVWALASWALEEWA